MIPPGKYRSRHKKSLEVEVLEECDFWQTVIFRQRAIAYRDLRPGKGKRLSVRLVMDFMEDFEKV
jgi:hypothetical protein